MRVDMAVQMAVQSGRASATALSFMFGSDEFRMAERPEMLRVAPRKPQPDWESGMVAHLDFTFTHLPSIEELVATSTSTAVRAAVTAAVREHEALDFMRDLQVAQLYLDAHQYGPMGMYSKLEATFEFPDSAPADAWPRLMGARRDINNEIASILNNITTCSDAMAQCNAHFFKYTRTAPGGGGGAPEMFLATDACWEFFYDCDSFEQVNSRADGTGKPFWLVPHYRRKFEDTFLEPCGCDVPEANPYECDMGGPDGPDGPGGPGGPGYDRRRLSRAAEGRFSIPTMMPSSRL